MTFFEGLPYAAFCMAVVFTVLIFLYLIIRIFSFAIYQFTKLGASPVSESSVGGEMNAEIYNRELELHNVDESTAAIIMAIVSNESGIPIDELRFKTIKAQD